MQITGRISSRQGAAFVAYADSFGLSRTSLAKLLILRELNRKSLRYMNGLPRDKDYTITVHYKEPKIKNQFETYAESLGIGPGEAAAYIFLLELNEKWLLKCLKS